MYCIAVQSDSFCPIPYTSLFYQVQNINVLAFWHKICSYIGMDRELSKAERNAARRKKLMPYILGIAGAAVCISVAVVMMRPSISAGDITLATADVGTIETSVTASGSVSPAFEEIINSPINTRVVEVYCKAGDSVEAGTPLLRLDLQSTETEYNKLRDQIAMKRYELEQQKVNNTTKMSNLEMQVKVKEMSVNRLEAELNNERYLDSLGSGTGDRVRQAELAYNTGCLELEQLRRQLDNERMVDEAGVKVKTLDINIADKNLGQMGRTLDDARVPAPRKATLTYIVDQIGQKVNEGERIAVVSDLSHFKVDGEVADSYGDRVRVGAKAVVKVGRDRMPGVITNVTPLSRNGVIAFTIRLDDDSAPRLRSGLKTDVYIMCDVMDEVVRIRNGSYFTGPGDYDLFVAEGDELVRRKVRLGESNYEYVEVKDGLRPGDKVVVNDMKKYANNNSIKIK